MKKPTAPAQGNAPTLAALSPDVKAKITEWNLIKEWLAKGSAREMELRKELVSLFVPKPVEGTNKVGGIGFLVTVGHKVTRTLDVAALESVMPQLPEDYCVLGHLIQYAPKFDLKVYRAMPDQARRIFEQALTIKEDGAPTLEIELREEVTGDGSGQALPPVETTRSRAQQKTMTDEEFAEHTGSKSVRANLPLPNPMPAGKPLKPVVKRVVAPAVTRKTVARKPAPSIARGSSKPAMKKPTSKKKR